jgi:2-(1,2-epoxy-1,2-dihydrophenyl)acetyl-CoA isomerase
MRLEIEGEIGTLVLDRPESFNAMSPEMISELPVVFSWLADSAGLRALIITGEGAAFCAGGDINWFRKGIEDPDMDIVAGVRAGAEVLHQGIIDMQRIEYPVIAAINGPAACAYGRIGASPDGGMTYFLPRVVGPARAVELLLNDPNLTPQAALEDGLVTEVVHADELMDRVRAKAGKLAAKSPHYVKMAKRLVHSSLDNTIAEHLQLERHGIAESMGTEDVRGAVAAFLDGRASEVEFNGR